MLRNKKIVAVVALVLMFALVVTGCGGQKPADSAQGGDGAAKTEIVIAQGSDAKSLDPHATNDQPSSRVMKQIYDQLIIQTEEMELVPGLAEKWTQIDDKTLELNLRKDVKFHNGEPFKASDVVFTFNRLLDPATASPFYENVEMIEKIEAKDDYTVVMTTKEPFAALIPVLAHTGASILNEKAVTESGENYGQNPVGTGPYKFSNWQSGDKIELVANDEYWQGAPALKKVTFRNIVEGTNRTIGLETGEVDLAYDIEPIDKNKVIDNEKLALTEDASLSVAYIGFNTKKAPFDKKEVRQAINYAINRDDIIAAVLNGAGEKAISPIGPNVKQHNKDVKPYDFNVEKAKELMKQAGLEGGFKTTLWTNDNPLRVQIAQIVQAQLKEIGIDVAIETLEWGSYLDRTAQGEHDMFILGWTTVTADADYGLFPLFHSSSKGAAGNRTFYGNPQVDELLMTGRTTIDPAAREKVYMEAQQMIVEDAPAAFLYHQTQNVGMQKGIKGFKLHPAGHHRIYGVSY